jgi:hypothetical protein
VCLCKYIIAEQSENRFIGKRKITSKKKLLTGQKERGRESLQKKAFITI